MNQSIIGESARSGQESTADPLGTSGPTVHEVTELWMSLALYGVRICKLLRLTNKRDEQAN
jgi:hypothetical protein